MEEEELLKLELACPKCSSTDVVAELVFRIDSRNLQPDAEVAQAVLDSSTLVRIETNCRACGALVLKEM